ncbi:MAG: endonuclease/exonuclease/phosphatase family protein [Prevotella sp.]|nr:endonuclease/exonuclease/phosphatase family protein [Prevotella sp.]
MRKQLIFTVLLAAMSLSCHAQEKTFALYAVGFYNQENLFDTIHDEGKNDYAFLPGGSYKWNTLKYVNKLKNMAQVLADLGTDKLPGVGCAFIGMAEVENDRVLDDLTAQEPIAERGLKYIHIEGPDKRGIDVAALYNPRLFTPKKIFDKQYVYENGDTTHHTRPFLVVQGELAGEDITFVVCHLPSRGAEGKFRDWGGKQVRALTDSIRASQPEMKIMVMGDMNDDPDNTSMAKYLGARREIKDVKKGDFYNPWWNILRKNGQGTLAYQGSWNLFDQIMLSDNLLCAKGEQDYSSLKFYTNHIFRRDYLMQTEGKYKGTPKRTSAGGVWMNGYSDHLPVVAYLIKELK